jgi:hypothetical protein
MQMNRLFLAMAVVGLTQVACVAATEDEEAAEEVVTTESDLCVEIGAFGYSLSVCDPDGDEECKAEVGGKAYWLLDAETALGKSVPFQKGNLAELLFSADPYGDDRWFKARQFSACTYDAEHLEQSCDELARKGTYQFLPSQCDRELLVLRFANGEKRVFKYVEKDGRVELTNANGKTFQFLEGSPETFGKMNAGDTAG